MTDITDIIDVRNNMNAIIELSRIRLERDLSYKALGEEVGLSERTIYRVLNFPKQRVHERTLFKIQRFLAAQKPAGDAHGATV